jgi:hypothetical protein
MMVMKMVMFHYPLQRTCAIARQPENATFDKLVNITIKGIQIEFMMEYMFRMQDYLFNQLIKSASDTDPYRLIKEQAAAAFESDNCIHAQ